MKDTKIQKLAVSAVMLALATVLSMIKVYQLPLGGSITLLSMLPI
ncbi:MAG: energy-coupled thiamine transporter ThiT, partial [Clostridia bacterium]|nr:energy-coupled thiamine transporter ThiT [Clostridia bacterium]